MSEANEYERKDEAEARKVARELTKLMNRCGAGRVTQAFVDELTRKEHRTLQQQTFGLFMECVKAWANCEPGDYDLRNEYTVKTSKKIMEATDYYSVEGHGPGVPFI